MKTQENRVPTWHSANRPVEVHSSGSVTLTGQGIEILQLVTIARGIKLEATGMRLTRGPSCLSIAKKRFGFKGSRETVLAAVLAKIAAVEAESGATREETLAVFDSTRF